VYTIRDYTAPLLGLPPEKVRVTAFPMGGCFGDGSQYRDVAAAAAVMSQAVGAPVRVQLMRWDESVGMEPHLERSWSSAPASTVTA
jgi:xanthine dehydrogenase molybdopterin-binding subunit B